MREIIRGRVVGEDRLCDIYLEAGKISAVKRAGRGRADVGGRKAIIAPTLFDIQVNGFAGIDLQDRKLTPQDVGKLSGLLAATGVSSWAPTQLRSTPT